MELKFRAWHKENEEYWEVMSILFDTQELELYEWGNVRFDEVIIEQYIGLKDINGKEIYVGDIVEIKDNKKYIIDFKNKANIGCNGGEYRFDITGIVTTKINGEVDRWGDCEYAYGKLIAGNVKVIGNIHENKELLY